MKTILNSYISQTEQLVYNYWPLILLLLIINLVISYLRSYRVKHIIKTFYSNIFLYFSSIKFFAWLLPFRLEEIISVFVLKKLIGKDGWGSSTSTIIVTKLSDYLIYFFIFFIVLAIYSSGRQNIFLGLSFLIVGGIIVSLAFNRREIIIANIIKNIKALVSKFPNSKLPLKLGVFFSDSSYIARSFVASSKFWSTTFLIAFLQILYACGVIFGASDKAIDFELFLIVLIYILTQAIPIRLFFGVGIFDIAVLLIGYFTTVGFSVNELILFRTLIFFVITLEMVFVFLMYTLINLSRGIEK